MNWVWLSWLILTIGTWFRGIKKVAQLGWTGPAGANGGQMGVMLMDFFLRWWFSQYRLKTFFYDNGTPFAPRICHGKFAVTDARRGAEREPPRALLRTVRRHPWFGTVHGGPCPRDTRRALARRPCWDSHHGRRSAGAAFGTLRSGHAVPQSALSSAPFDPGVGSILPFGRLGCSNRRGTVPDSSMLV